MVEISGWVWLVKREFYWLTKNFLLWIAFFWNWFSIKNNYIQLNRPERKSFSKCNYEQDPSGVDQHHDWVKAEGNNRGIYSLIHFNFYIVSYCYAIYIIEDCIWVKSNTKTLQQLISCKRGSVKVNNIKLK